MKRIFMVAIISPLLIYSYWDIRYNTIAQWEVAISNYGKFGQSKAGNTGAFWPRNSGHNYIFGAGIWIGAIAPNGDTLVTIGYDPSGGVSEFTPGIPYSSYIDPRWKVYFSFDNDYPFTSVSMEDGYAVFHDFDPTQHIPNDTRPIGSTVTLKTFVWPKDWANDILFFKYIIKNDTNYTINNIYAGICMDYDIGDEVGPAANDRGGIDLPRKLFFGWQEQPEPGWDSRGMIGFKLLSPYSLSCFKRLTLNFAPNIDWQRYMVMAGYNFQNGNYEPFDTVWFPPDDQRILMSAGVWNLPPGDSIILDWALIASHDSVPPSPEMEYKADKAQTLFETPLHNVTVVNPNGGEVVSGIYQINYTANSSTNNPLLVDIFFKSEHGLDTIALNQPNSGNFFWHTDSCLDCVLGKILIMVYDTITFGFDGSNNYFIINNPGNAPPYFKVYSPKNYHSSYTVDTLARELDINWFARDPEFQDSLYINIYFKSQYDTSFVSIALNEPNDSHFIWNTLSYRNGSGLLVVETHDEEFTVAETIPVYLKNQISGGPINQISGINNIVNLACLVHQPENLTGHNYELEFLQYQRIKEGTYLHYPEYIYKLTDLNTGQVVLDTYSLKNAYFRYYYFNDYSPIVDGFSIRAFTPSPNVIRQTNFHNDSVRVVVGSYPEDSIYLYGTSNYTWWAYRGSTLQLDWVIKPCGGLTLLVTDLNYNDTIPYKPYNRYGLNPDSAYGWCFVRFLPTNSPPSDTFRPGYDNVIMLCGEVIRLRAHGTFPQVGERWIVYPSQYSPPIKGNIYRFAPINYVAEIKSPLKSISFNIFPVPSKNNLTITYSLSKAQKISLIVYDVVGRQVKRLRDGIEKSGDYKIFWNGFDDNNRKVSSGVYFCRFETEGYSKTKKFIIMR
ncbi:MAG: T9SS type A sorting domain-containing protein [candidate division WOR-3 bacterium]